MFISLNEQDEVVTTLYGLLYLYSILREQLGFGIVAANTIQ